MSVVGQDGSLRIARKDATALRSNRLPEQLFFEAVLARVEVNRNRDEFTPTHLSEVAATLAHTPIDDDHAQPVVQGHILSARFDPDLANPSGTKGALVFGGVTWPRRFPDVAAGLLDGTVKFSVESVAEQVECSSCHAHFPTTAEETEYCACLQARHTTQATSRLWHENRGVGAAFTTNPAGTDCIVEPGSLLLVASYDEAASPPEVSGMLLASDFTDYAHDKTAKETPAPMDPKKIAALLASLADSVRAGAEMHSSDTSEEALIAAVRPTFSQLIIALRTEATAEVQKATDALTATHQAALETLKAEGETALVAEKRVASLRALPATFPDPEAHRTLVASLSEDAWTFSLAGYQAAEKAASVVPTPAATTPAAAASTAPDPKVGAGLLANANTGTGAAPTTTATQGAGGGAAGAPRSLSEMTMTRGENPASK